MKNKFIKFGLKFIFWLVITWLVFVLSIMQHEKAHKQIFTLHQVESEIDYGFLMLSATTQPINRTNEIFSSEMYLAHDITEAIGYQLKPVILLLVLIICIMLENLKQKKRKK